MERDCGGFVVVVVDAVAVVDSLQRKLTLEMAAFDYLYGGQFTLSTQLIKPNYVVAVVSLLDRVLSSLHVVAFFSGKVAGCPKRQRAHSFCAQFRDSTPV